MASKSLTPAAAYTAAGKYHTACGEDVVPTTGKQQGWRRKPEEDAIIVDGAHEGIIPLALFNRVQRKLPKLRGYQPKRRADYPLAGLIFCGHCGKPMYGSSVLSTAKHGGKQYEYHQYICSTYVNRNGPSNPTCSRHPIDADRVLGWLVQKLQEVYLGPGRDALVQEIRKQLKADTKAGKSDVGRLQKRAAELEREVARLVKAIRTIDAAELVEELALVQAERERVKAELAQAGRLTDAADLDAEAERIADGLWKIGERLTASEPAILREALHQFVSRITCRWEPCTGRSLSRLVGGTVELRPQTPFSDFSAVAQATSSPCSRSRLARSRCSRTVFCGSARVFQIRAYEE